MDQPSRAHFSATLSATPKLFACSSDFTLIRLRFEKNHNPLARLATAKAAGPRPPVLRGSRGRTHARARPTRVLVGGGRSDDSAISVL